MQCIIVAKNDEHKLVIIYSPRFKKWALIAKPFTKNGKTKTIRQTDNFQTLFDLFGDWVGDNFILY